MSAPCGNVPEQRIALVLKQGVSAITSDPTLLNPILSDLSDNDLTSIRTYWTNHPPIVLSGYARSEGPFPCFAITLTSEEIAQDYVGVGQEAYFLGSPPVYNPSDDKQGSEYKRRVTGTYGIHIYAEHPDVCSLYYRVARRIMNVGMWRLLEGALNEPVLSGQELAPDASYTPDNLFVRRLSVTVEYEEKWTNTDALAAALMNVEEFTTADTLAILHEDSGGGVHPITT